MSKTYSATENNGALTSVGLQRFSPSWWSEWMMTSPPGSWFVLERWIAEFPFRCAAQPAQSDLDVARGHGAKQILEEHWKTWITEEDWAWLRITGFNSVRIPIGYYHLSCLDPSLLDGTDFHGLADVYANAWVKITEAFELAYKYRIGILIDLHAAPGKQNPDSHSGTSNKPGFFCEQNLHLTSRVLCTLLTHLNHFLHSHSPPLPNFIGIQLLNEPHPPSDSFLQSWYTTTIHQLRSIDPTIPIYLSECWRPTSYASWLSSQHAHSPGLLVLDHHYYKCFASADIHTPSNVHTASLIDPNTNSSTTAQQFSTITEILRRIPGAGSDLVIGEWSGALNPQSFTSTTSTGQREETRRYIEAQIQLFDKTCAGWFFWTFKKQQSGDYGWSLRDAIGAGTFPSHIGLRLEVGEAREREGKGVVDTIVVKVSNFKSVEKGTAAENHRQWWAKYPGYYEHRRFEEGFDKGWDDALSFIRFDSSELDVSLTELGFVHAWARRRTGDYGTNYWEFEHGFVQGVDAARRVFIRESGKEALA